MCQQAAADYRLSRWAGKQTKNRAGMHARLPASCPPARARCLAPRPTWVWRVAAVQHLKVRLGPGGDRQAHIVVVREVLLKAKLQAGRQAEGRGRQGAGGSRGVVSMG